MAKKRTRASSPRGLQVVTLCISTALVLILLGLVVFTIFTGRNLSTYVKENLTVTMLLADDATAQEASQLCKQLQQRPYMAHLEYISKERVLKEQAAGLGTDPSEFAGGNPFPATIEFQLRGDYANADSLKWISKELKALPKVTDLAYPQDLIDSVNNTLRQIGIVLLVLAALLAFVSFALINNTVRLAVYSRRFSIHTMKLVGASWGFIRWPFIRRSLWLGLLAALLALVVLGAGVFALYDYEPNVAEVITPEVLIITGVVVVALGLLLSVMCTWLSVNKFLRMKAGALYKI